MQINKNKVFTIMYAVSILSVISGIFVGLYNLILAYTKDSTGESLFYTLSILAIALCTILTVIILLNAFNKDKFYWFEIVFASITLIVNIIMLALSQKDLYISAYLVSFFEIASACFALIISRVCVKFLKSGDINNEEN